MIVGRLGQDPELRYTQGGAGVATLNVATNENWVDKSGQKQERTEWHRVVVWGKQAENSAQYLKKGRQVFVEGRLQTRQWQDQSGNKRYTTEIVAQNVQFLGGARAESGMDQSQQQYGAPAAASNSIESNNKDQSTPGPLAGQGGGSEEPAFTEDDIPF